MVARSIHTRQLGLGPREPRARLWEQVRAGFPEFAAAGRCRFGDCGHQNEPDCAVRASAAAGRVSPARYASYLRILHSLEPGRPRR